MKGRQLFHPYEVSCGSGNGRRPSAGSTAAAGRGAMGGACPSPAPPRVPLGGWYLDGQRWVHVEIKVVITDDQRDDGLRGEGGMSSTNALEVYFEHAPGRQRRGVMEAEGDILWDNGKTWKRHCDGATT